MSLGVGNNNRNLITMLVTVLIVSSGPLDSFAFTAKATGIAIIAATSITVNPAAGSGGTMATISGLNFFPNEQIVIILIDSNNHSHILGKVTSDSNGMFAIQVTIPYKAYPGSATIYAQHNHVTAATTTFTIPFPTLSLTPVSGGPSTQVTVTGKGFALNQGVDIFIGPDITHKLKKIGHVTTDGTGGFVTNVKIPPHISPSVYFISARENVNREIYAAAPFTVS